MDEIQNVKKILVGDKKNGSIYRRNFAHFIDGEKIMFNNLYIMDRGFACYTLVDINNDQIDEFFDNFRSIYTGKIYSFNVKNDLNFYDINYEIYHDIYFSGENDIHIAIKPGIFDSIEIVVVTDTYMNDKSREDWINEFEDWINEFEKAVIAAILKTKSNTFSRK